MSKITQGLRASVPFKDRRDSAHDTLCARVLRKRTEICEILCDEHAYVLAAEVEHPVASGFVDIVIITSSPSRASDASETLVCEVKTEREGCSAGDVIRQLKRYSASIKERAEPWEHPLHIRCVVFSGHCEAEDFCYLIAYSGFAHMIVEDSSAPIMCEQCEKIL